MIHFLKMAGGYAAVWLFLIVMTPVALLAILLGKTVDRVDKFIFRK